MTVTLEDLHPTPVRIRAAGADLEFGGLDVQDFRELVRENPALAYIFLAPAEKLPAALVKAALDAGPEVINSILNRTAIGWDFDAADAPFTAMEQVKMVKAIVEHSLPSADLGKLKAEVMQSLEALGLIERQDGKTKA